MLPVSLELFLLALRLLLLSIDRCNVGEFALPTVRLEQGRCNLLLVADVLLRGVGSSLEPRRLLLEVRELSFLLDPKVLPDLSERVWLAMAVNLRGAQVTSEQECLAPRPAAISRRELDIEFIFLLLSPETICDHIIVIMQAEVVIQGVIFVLVPADEAVGERIVL